MRSLIQRMKAEILNFGRLLKVEYLPLENFRLSLDFTLTRKDGTVEVFNSAQHNDFFLEEDPAKKACMNGLKQRGLNID